VGRTREVVSAGCESYAHHHPLDNGGFDKEIGKLAGMSLKAFRGWSFVIGEPQKGFNRPSRIGDRTN
jgi:hypothetical protein